MAILERTIIGVCLLSATVAFSDHSVAETGKRGDADAVQRGHQLYETHCETCHRREGVGEPPIPLGIRRPEYIVAMPLDESSHAWHHDDDSLVRTILRGNQRSRLRMPVFESTLSVGDARDLVAYIKTFWGDRILQCQGPKHMSCM